MNEFAPITPLPPRVAGAPAPVSPSELLKSVLERELPPELIPGGVTVGPVSDDQIQAGCISLMNAGRTRPDRSGAVIWVRSQVRCLAPTLEHVERIGRGVSDRTDQRGRTETVQKSTGDRYLIHVMNTATDPSMHKDSPENFETLLFVEMCVGLDTL